MEGKLDSETSKLMQKYVGGRIPPLVDLVDPHLGLIDKNILERYLRDTMAVNQLPLGILLAADGGNSIKEKWQWGDFEINQWARMYWPAFCRKVRELSQDLACELCDRRRAAQAESQDSVIAYLCDNGLIDFAAPVRVREKVVAMLFSGQYKPREGTLWNPDFIKPDGLFTTEGWQGRGVSAWEESQQRIRIFAQAMDCPVDELLNILSAPDNSVKGLSPEEIPEVEARLILVSEELSQLATSTYEMEKGRVDNYIQNRITRALQYLSDQPAENTAAWKALSSGLDLSIQFFEYNYAIILSWIEQRESTTLKILCHAGIPVEAFGSGEEFRTKNSEIAELEKSCKAGEPFRIDLRKQKHTPFFGKLLTLHESQPNKALLAFPIPGPPKAAPLTLLLGRFKRDISSDQSNEEVKALLRFAQSIELVTKSIILVDLFDNEVKNRNLFLEDIAHDIRNPIQNMIVTSEVLSIETFPIETHRNAAKSLAAQARHIDNMSKRIWMLSKIDSGKIEHGKIKYVHIYQTLTGIRKSLLVLAEKRSIEFTIDKNIQDWRPIQVNEELFLEAALNLSENAIKYSREKTEIKVYGEYLALAVKLTWDNRGIQVREEDKERIFERYTRSDEAIRYTQVGRGIGLFIVKTFIDECDGHIDVTSAPIKGTEDYQTRFTLTIPLRW